MIKKTNSIAVFIVLLVNTVSPTLVLAQKQYAFDSIQMIGNNFRYGYLEPDASNANKKYPLVLALHGDEWRSTFSNMDWGVTPEYLFEELFAFSSPFGIEFYLAKCWKSNDFFDRHPAHVLVPHIHTDMQLSDSGDVVWSHDDVVAFLDSLIDSRIVTGRVDTNRIYVTGHSVGGAGTLLTSLKLKHKVAALVPSAPALSSDIFEQKIIEGAYDKMALWYCNPDVEDAGTAFTTMKNNGLCHTYIKSAGMELQNITAKEIQQKIDNRHRYLQTEYFKPYPKGGHHYVMDYLIQDTSIYDWMFRQYRIDDDAIKITSFSRNNYQLAWQLENSNDTVEIWFRDSTDWQLLTKEQFVQNSLILTDYVEKEKLEEGFVKVCCVNSEGFVYGLTEGKLSEYTSTSLHSNNSELFSVYPNPFNNLLQIADASNLRSCRLYNSMGIVVAEQVSGYLNTSNLANGVYILRIEKSNGTIKTIKLIKK